MGGADNRLNQLPTLSGGSLEGEITNRWDKYFYNICCAISHNSKCLSRQIGATIVWDRSIVSTGYNGPPRGVEHCKGIKCPRQVAGFKSGEGLHMCPASHAEINSIVNAAKLGVKVDGCTMYMNCPVPCKDCLKYIINAGIKEIVCISDELYDALSHDILLDVKDTLSVRTFL